MSKKIEVSKGLCALVDDDDYEELNQYKWHACKCKNTFYVNRTVSIPTKETISMHRFITNAQKGQLVDHINGDGLDNRRANLRICTRSENGQNISSVSGKSRFKGVYFHKKNRNWVAEYRKNGKKYHLGCFTNEDDAARAYDSSVLMAFGEFAKTNAMLDLY